MRKWTLVQWICALAIPLALVGGCASDLGSTADQNLTPQEQGVAIANQVEDEISDDSARPIDALPYTVGPAGSLFGLQLDDGNRLFLLGDAAENGAITIHGAVIEDVFGNLIMRQENREDGVTITLSSGDAFDLDAGGPNLRMTLMLAGTTPASVVVVDFDEFGGHTVDEAASSIRFGLNTEYNVEPVRLPRASGVLKLQPVYQSGPDCPTIDIIIDSAQALCTVYQTFTTNLPEEGLKAACIGVDLFLDALRGSLPFINETELAPKLIAALKIGVAATCELVSNIWSVGKVVKKLTPVDLGCFAVSLLDESSRLFTQDGLSMSDAICAAGAWITGSGDLPSPEDPNCSNTCAYANDDICDDGGPGSEEDLCPLGTDCNDCGPADRPETVLPDCQDDGICNLECPSSQLDPDCTAEQVCAAILYCCPNDEICDAHYCPGSAVDPDCSNADLCMDRGVCCPNDGICDIAACPDLSPDPDCTNSDFCSRLQVCCDDDRCDTPAFPCPQPDYDCSFCGVIDGVCIGECNPPDPDCAESGAMFGSISGTVVDATTGAPLAGAVVTVVDSGQTATTDSAGVFSIENVLAGAQTLAAAFAGYIDANVPVEVEADQVAVAAMALVMQLSNDRITVVLSWGEEPYDLDLHMSGPGVGSARFHAYYGNRNPTDYVCLDRDDTGSYGPETMSIGIGAEGTFVAGSYHIWVHNYSEIPSLSVSNATVSIFAGGAQIAQYLENNASGDGNLKTWRVVEFDVGTSGQVTVTSAVENFADGSSSSEF